MAASAGDSATAGTPGAAAPFSDDWRERIYIPAVAGGVVGAAFGLLTRHRARLGAARAAATYALNLAIATGCYGGARELARDARSSTPDDPMNSVVGGLASGAVLGRIQGGHFGAVKYAATFAVAGIALDYAALKLAPEWHALKEQFSGSKEWFTLPEWFPIQVLDEEALAKKRAREEKLFAMRALGKFDKEEP
ncbi:hypothetical protein PR202_gb26057 [Eleusine coracana subsp. coracana]|uniref:Uncharacterized protein n=1 Tax=Eleusine coracana subsp. coracana TaxID=191504 RepID=A0AAV5FQV5_ELECO|nr:hypothetical protein QOZ80_4BG0356930 [Eleusine coracana subsp. coracana]GJN37132.1 hypothetical protein PR202_gb26057 [Eleusine coracana subsp. coracana]